MIRYFFVLTLLFSGGYSSPIKLKDPPTCQACHPVDPNKINVHLIPHSHDDVGWLKTVDQYYYGSHGEIQKAGVQYIISSTVEALKEDANRRFVQVETAFFWKWWQHQSDSIKQDVINLVNNGQLEIINAAWSMNDEAATNYQSTIDQFTYGLRTINDTIGTCGNPRIGWQIDPFGHSREQASIFAQLGFDAVFLGRLDYNDHSQRNTDKTMQVIWKASANSDNLNIFTDIFPDMYGSPPGFCFDIECGDEVLVDDNSSPDYNIPRKVDDFLNQMVSDAVAYRTRNILIPMGGDFQYQSAQKNFVNMDKLIAGFKDNEQINIIYSTPSCYVKAVNEEATANNIEFVVKEDDFFPYASGGHNYWTGYFTSRPNAKRFERTTNNILQVAKQLASFSKVNGEDHENDLVLLKQAIGILQHHDAITGTAKEAVANDYVRLLTKGIKTTEPTLTAIVNNLLKKDTSSDINLNLQTCLLVNTSICDTTSSNRFVVVAYNPLERPVTHYVRLPVPDGTYTITGPNGEVSADLVDSIASFSYVDSNIGKPQPKEIVFAAKDLPGFGLSLYVIEKTASKSAFVKQTSTLKLETDETENIEIVEPAKLLFTVEDFLGFEFISSLVEMTPPKSAPRLKFGTDTTGFEIDDATGLLKSVTMNGQTVAITQEFLYYRGFNGTNDGEDNAASGAYIFRPIDEEAIKIADSVTVTSTTGTLVDEVRQVFNDWITQIIRMYKGADANYIEFDWLVGPIEVDTTNGIGREIVSRFTINGFDNGEAFYTDSNGRELIKRQLNKRYDYEYDPTLEPVASNYYPITSKIVIKDEIKNLEVAVLNDRAQGGSSLKNGVIELMVHRRLLKDDAKGVGEGLDDIEFNQGVVARGQHYLVIGSTDANDIESKSTAAQERELALTKLLTPLLLVADASSDDLTLAKIQSAFNFNFEGLQNTLPENVHILTLEPWKEDSYILRLEHILENGEDVNLSQAVTVDLEGLFTLFDITEIRETTLGANQWLDEFEAREKFVWNAQGKVKIVNKKSENMLRAGDLTVTLNPMQIRTFIINVSKSK